MQQRLHKKLAPCCCRMCSAWVSGFKLSDCLFVCNRKLILILLELEGLLCCSACSTVLGTAHVERHLPALLGASRASLRKPNAPRLFAIPPGTSSQPLEAVEQEELEQPQHQPINKQHFYSHPAPHSAAAASKFNSRVPRCLAKHTATWGSSHYTCQVLFKQTRESEMKPFYSQWAFQPSRFQLSKS